VVLNPQGERVFHRVERAVRGTVDERVVHVQRIGSVLPGDRRDEAFCPEGTAVVLDRSGEPIGAVVQARLIRPLRTASRRDIHLVHDAGISTS
jgi:hypothetical protein